MEVFAGTSGFSYKEWLGSFYPEKLPAKQMLAHYATQLNTVEINNTFYRMPKRTVLESWAAEVPEHFRFSIKATRRITHIKRLKDVDEELGYLFKNLASLGERLGVVLFQLPPRLAKDVERLRSFLSMLPAEIPVAMEFRHASWCDNTVDALLQEHGVARCVADVEEAEQAPPDDVALPSSAEFGYLRLRRPHYERDALQRWAERLRATGWQRAYLFFKHEDEAGGPAMARQFMEQFAAAK